MAGRADGAIAIAQRATLAASYVLYLPSLWWHGVARRDEVGAMANYWWRDAPAGALTPFHSQLHAVLTMRDLPPVERAAWRAFFDHYVFHDDGDPAAYLPVGARGVLGDRSEKVLANLRETLATALP